MPRIAAAAAVLLLAGASAQAQEAREFCANRPGRGSPPCVLDAGRFQAEASGADFTHNRRNGVVTDTTLLGDLAFRLGVTGSGEAQLAFSPYMRIRAKDAGGSSRATGYSDLTLAWRQSLRNPDGSGVSIALEPFVTAPTAKRGFGAGGWQGGVTVPMAFPLPGGLGLGVTPQLAAVKNAGRGGSHLGASGVVGVSRPFGAFSVGAEIYVNYDDDPSGDVVSKTFDLAGAWIPPGLKATQFDVGVNAGLDRHAPDYQFYAGVAHRF